MAPCHDTDPHSRCALLLSALLPIVFIITLGGFGIVSNPFTSLSVFTALFQTPHWYIGQDPSLWWQALYSYKALIVPAILLTIVYTMHTTRRTPRTIFLMTTSLALFISSFFIATAIWPPDVISYERGNYAKRLLELILVLLLPFLLEALQSVIQKIHTLPSQVMFAVGGALILTISFYFTYPTRDPVSLYTGYAVRDADLAAVQFIDERNNGVQEYIVLTNQMTGAAALHEFSFSTYHEMADGSLQYFYSIPTGGPLYQYFRQMVYEEPKKAWMVDAMEFAGVDRHTLSIPIPGPQQHKFVMQQKKKLTPGGSSRVGEYGSMNTRNKNESLGLVFYYCLNKFFDIGGLDQYIVLLHKL